MNRMMDSKAVTLVLTMAIVFSFAAAAQAVVVPLSAVIDCAQANAGAGTCAAGGTGMGTGNVTVDTVTNELTWNIAWSGLSGDLTVAHFHGPALPDQNAGVQVDFLGIAPGNPSIGSTTISDAQEADLLDNLWYINIHSTTFTGGEIRGQVIPEPSALVLGAFGLLGGWAYRRRRCN